MMNNNKIITCIKERDNFSNIEKHHKFDNKSFAPEKVREILPIAAPKLYRLIEHIKNLDEEDITKHNKLFKHLIYSDLKSPYGAKIIASALAANGFIHAYTKDVKSRSFQIKSNLKTYKQQVFATLVSTNFFEKALGVKFRKELLTLFNSRPDNNHGELIRFIVLDPSFKEGIDLHDLKYIHIIEPLLNKADETQIIGRGTRFCGQRGLTFHKTLGWPLYVYKYISTIPEDLEKHIKNHTKMSSTKSISDIMFSLSNIDFTKQQLILELDNFIKDVAVDKSLTENIHQSVSGIPIGKQLEQYKWPPIEKEDNCNKTTLSNNEQKIYDIVDFTPTQNFLMNFFKPEYPLKGMLYIHSTGTGKTCTAIATAASFEKQGYTIMYITRTTLKDEVFKNMFTQSCLPRIQEVIKNDEMPSSKQGKRKLIPNWINPISFKQLSNAFNKKGAVYKKLIKINTENDPIRKTLIIIDEAHKLYVHDPETPNMKIIENAILKSYKVSGTDSVRLLLMTATPYEHDPMNFIKLINLLKEQNDKIEDDFNKFKSAYLTKEGRFTSKGNAQLNKKLSGYISYLNREKDISSFAQPIISEIKVPISEYEFKTEMSQYTKKTIIKPYKTDKSQQKYIEKCLNLEPMYTKYLQEHIKPSKPTKKGNKTKAQKNASPKTIPSKVPTPIPSSSPKIQSSPSNLQKPTLETPSVQQLKLFNEIPKDNLYIVIGHGNESILDFNERTELQKDKVLVLFQVCGLPNSGTFGCIFMDFFSNPKNKQLLENPFKNQEIIEKALGFPIRVYLPGDKVPAIKTDLFSHFKVFNKILIEKSGVFKHDNFPMPNRKLLPEEYFIQYELGHRKCIKFSGVLETAAQYDKNIHTEVFKGNIYEPASKYAKFDILKHKRLFKLSDVMENVGPGIYYFIGCRTADTGVKAEKLDKKKYNKILVNSNAQQLKKKKLLSK